MTKIRVEYKNDTIQSMGLIIRYADELSNYFEKSSFYRMKNDIDNVAKEWAYIIMEVEGFNERKYNIKSFIQACKEAIQDEIKTREEEE